MIDDRDGDGKGLRSIQRTARHGREAAWRTLPSAFTPPVGTLCERAKTANTSRLPATRRVCFAALWMVGGEEFRVDVCLACDHRCDERFVARETLMVDGWPPRRPRSIMPLFPVVPPVWRLLWLAAALVLASAGCTTAAAYGTLGAGIPRVSRFLVEPAGKCGGPLHSYSYQMCCPIQVPIHEALRSTTELQEFVQKYGKHGRVRPVGALHSSNSQICVEHREDRAIRLTSLVLDPGYVDVRVIEGTGPDGAKIHVADVDASLTLARLNDRLSAQGFTLGFGSVFFRGVSVAGALATGAHGSSLAQSSVLSTRLLTITMVDANGELREFSPDSTASALDLWPALQTHMGQLGIVTRVKLRVDEDFWAKVTTDHHHERALLRPGGAARLLEGCEWGHIVWYPRAHHYLRQCGVDNRGPPKDPRECREKVENALLAPYATPWMTNTFKKYMQVRGKRDRCWLEDAAYGVRRRHPTLRTVDPHSVDRREFEWKREAVDRPHLLTSSGVSRFQENLPQLDFEIAIPLRHADAALAFLKRTITEERMCLPLIGVFLRFSAAASPGLIAHANHGTGEKVMFVEMVVYAGPHWRIDDDDLRPYLAAVSHLISKFEGQPHWGKNHETIFRAQLVQEPDYAARVARFARVAHCLDPRGVFSTSFARAVGLRGPASAPAPDCDDITAVLKTDSITTGADDGAPQRLSVP